MADAIGGRAELARTARELAAEWGIELGEPFALSRYSYVAPAGADAVLKVASRADDESAQEVEALELWGGDGAVRLLRADRERRALLLERARLAAIWRSTRSRCSASPSTTSPHSSGTRSTRR